MVAKSEEIRFFQDAEFVQALSNIDYVLWIAKQGYFDQHAFMNYLEYLTYFKLPEYAIHLTYMRGIEVLDFVRDPKIRTLLKEDPLTLRRILMDQLWSAWARKEEVDPHR